MSRSEYSYDCDGWALIRWRGTVASAISGHRGQAMLRELAQALDAMPQKRLAAESLVTADGEYCALGALGHARGLDMATIDTEDREAVAKAFGIAEALAAEIMNQNDDSFSDWWYFENGRIPRTDVAECRWQYMRVWVEKQLQEEKCTTTTSR